jgi:hypothetical protein
MPASPSPPHSTRILFHSARHGKVSIISDPNHRIKLRLTAQWFLSIRAVRSKDIPACSWCQGFACRTVSASIHDLLPTISFGDLCCSALSHTSHKQLLVPTHGEESALTPTTALQLVPMLSLRFYRHKLPFDKRRPQSSRLRLSPSTTTPCFTSLASTLSFTR